MKYRQDEIRENYKRMADEELIDLSREKDLLTPDACDALLAELADRGIRDEAPEVTTADQAQPAPSEADDYLQSEVFGPESPGAPSSEFVAVFSAPTEAEAKAAQASLKAAGIESELQTVVLVAQIDSENAIRTISGELDDDPESEESPGA